MDDRDKERVYLDFNGTCPVAGEVVNGITTALKDYWANPSSTFSLGVKARDAVDQARTMVARMLGANDSDGIIFTSGGTESNNLTINSVLRNFEKHESTDNRNRKPHVISTNIEHDSVRCPLQHLQDEGKIEYTQIPVSPKSGTISVESLLQAIRPNTRLVSVMLANNETGVLQPVADIAQALKQHCGAKDKNEINSKIFLHTDASQAVGKIYFSVQDLNVDYLTITGHKFYGPRNGALYVKNLSKQPDLIRPMLFGGGQESGYRPGTENTPLIFGLGIACQRVLRSLPQWTVELESVRNYFEERLITTFGDNVKINFRDSPRLPNTSSVAFHNMSCSSKELLKICQSFCASTGAACHAGNKGVSAVLLASGIPESVASKTVRFSVGVDTTEEDIELVIAELESLGHVLCGEDSLHNGV